MLFSDLNLHPDLMQGLDSMGFKKATPVQQQAIPLILEGKDLLACAQTGTGKTAAFVLPIIHNIVQQKITGPSTLVIVPTRELAQQIDQQIEGLGYFVTVGSMAVFGGGDGSSWEAQRKSLLTGVDIVVATPGRLIAMLSTGKVDFSNLKYLVLDEADRMLDMGFYDDIMRIISFLPENRQTLMFSATMPPRIETLANRILINPVRINLSLSKPAEGIMQQAYVVYDRQKDQLLQLILENPDYDSILVFASTKIKVKKINDLLKQKKINSKAFHSDLEQQERTEILREFKNRNTRLIVATDVLARGIDVDNISLVINFDAPGDPEDYVHRVGRTARAARRGVAITFIGEMEQRKFARVEKLIGMSVPKVPLPDPMEQGPEYSPDKKRRHHPAGQRSLSSRHPGKKQSAEKTKTSKKFFRKPNKNKNSGGANA